MLSNFTCLSPNERLQINFFCLLSTAPPLLLLLPHSVPKTKQKYSRFVFVPSLKKKTKKKTVTISIVPFQHPSCMPFVFQKTLSFCLWKIEYQQRWSAIEFLLVVSSLKKISSTWFCQSPTLVAYVHFHQQHHITTEHFRASTSFILLQPSERFCCHRERFESKKPHSHFGNRKIAIKQSMTTAVTYGVNSFSSI